MTESKSDPVADFNDPMSASALASLRFALNRSEILRAQDQVPDPWQRRCLLFDSKRSLLFGDECAGSLESGIVLCEDADSTILSEPDP